MASAISLFAFSPSERGLLGVLFGVFPMRGGMVLRGFAGVVFGLHVMAMRNMSMVGGLLVIALFVMLSGVQVMLRGVFMVLRGVAMMIGVFLRHGKSSLREIVNLFTLCSAISIGAANYKEIAGGLQRYFPYRLARVGA
jgi:hypothetical protein